MSRLLWYILVVGTEEALVVHESLIGSPVGPVRPRGRTCHGSGAPDALPAFSAPFGRAPPAVRARLRDRRPSWATAIDRSRGARERRRGRHQRNRWPRLQRLAAAKPCWQQQIRVGINKTVLAATNRVGINKTILAAFWHHQQQRRLLMTPRAAKAVGRPTDRRSTTDHHQRSRRSGTGCERA